MKLVKIFAVWCPACIIMRNRLEEIKEKYKEIEQIEYDYDLDEEIVKKYNIDSMLPVLILFNGDKEIIRIKGEKTVKEICDILDGVL